MFVNDQMSDNINLKCATVWRMNMGFQLRVVSQMFV